MEYHTFTGEGILPLDGDIYVHLAPPTPKGVIPMDKVEAFFVPKGTLLSIRMGVWHGAPFAAGSEPVNVMCVLPERTYANDGYFHMVPEDEQIKITNE
jgi:ureidoglycolate lyase